MKESFALDPRCLILLLSLAAGCSSGDAKSSVVQSGKAPDPDGRLFTLLPSSYTGVAFQNRVLETREHNVFTYRNFYNGGGVAIGDLSGDGLPEIVLTSNQEGPRLFLNQGAFRFRDVTSAARLRAESDSWTTGVALADVNGDGRLDVYISRAGPYEPDKRRNELWIHQGVRSDGIPTFREMAERYGVADAGYSTQSAFLDYDRDGDLDLFVVNNSPRPASSFGMRNVRHVRDPYGSKLYRNEGERFTDVSVAARIHSPEVAFGLGIAVGDVNRDGLPDVYIANDFFERDYLYMNRGDGTFAEALDRQMPVVSYFSMGLDIGDVDNDGWPDIYTTDMLPESEYRLKTTTMFEGWDTYQRKVQNGYHHQLMRNMLQRNNRDGTFSDIAELAGVARTDWSWSALIADLNLDGFKDIFVTNGLARDLTSQDYVAFLANEETMKEVTSGGRKRVDFVQLTNAMSSTPLSNYAFQNKRGARFTNAAATWGLDSASFSNGAAYGDLNGDGALDLVINNVNGDAFVYRSNARSVHPENRFLRVRLEGEGKNRFALGARVTVLATREATMREAGSSGREAGRGKREAQLLMQELAPVRGFQSSVDYTLVFGLGSVASIDSLIVDWPDGRVTKLANISVNQTVTVKQSDASRFHPPSSAGHPPASRVALPTFAAADSSLLPNAHRENEFVDFDRERLIPKMLSTEGPHIAVADVNGDGLDDAYIGGAKEQPRRLLIQQEDGRFVAQPQEAFEADLVSEDVGVTFFDANGDGSKDLYVVSGGNEYSDRSPALQDRLYFNDGRGSFRKAEGHLPVEHVSGSRVVPADYDADGDIDLFIGGRVIPWRYGMPPRSALLRNDGRGKFTDVTAQLAPTLQQAGMVTDAIWLDVDKDRRIDLIVVGEWMPITIFRNVGDGRLERREVRGLERSHGWWNRIVAADFTGDGRVDFVVGNLGLNARLAANDSQPATMYVADFDHNGFVEQILSCYNEDVSYPLALRDDLIKTLPYLKARFLNYKDYALKTVNDIFQAKELAEATVLKAHTFATTFVRSNPDGSYSLVPLPSEAQVAPVYGILAEDVDADGAQDLLLAGNFDGFKPEIGRMTASRGLVLRGDGRGGFTPVQAAQSGFVVAGQARDIQKLRSALGKPLYVVTRNNDRPLLFERAHSMANGVVR